MRKLFVTLLLTISWVAGYCDELLQFSSPETGWFANTDPTRAMYWSFQDDRAIVVFLPGGEGNFNMDKPWARHRVSKIGSTVTLIPGASGVFLDSPYSLGMTGERRYSNAHLARVTSVLLHLKQTTNKPIWLYGHSNGSISAMTVYQSLQGTENANLVSGIIMSGTRNAVSAPKAVSVPVLFIHHSGDGCRDTDYASAMRIYNTVKERNSSRTEFVTISTPPVESFGHPCFGGAHMFDGLYPELAQHINTFITK